MHPSAPPAPPARRPCIQPRSSCEPGPPAARARAAAAIRTANACPGRHQAHVRGRGRQRREPGHDARDHRAFKTAIHHADPGLSAARLQGTQTAAVVIALLFGVAGMGLWIWMATASRSGRRWARTTATVIFGLYTLAQASDLSRPEPLSTRLVAGILWLIGLSAIALLWSRDSGTYFTTALRHDPTSGGEARQPGS